MNIKVQRLSLLTEFGAMMFAQLKHPSLTKGTPYNVLPLRTGQVYTGVLGQRVCSLKFNVGLDNERLLAVLTPEKLAHFIPWDCTPYNPAARIEGRYVVIEAPWPAGLQRSKITLDSLGQSPHDGTRFIAGPDQRASTVTLTYAEIIHVLIGGTTGSGKSTVLQSVGYQATRGNLKDYVHNSLVLLCGKQGEGLGLLNGLPGQQGPLAISADEWVNALGWIADEIDNRYKQVVLNRGRKGSYGGENQKPRIIVIADEPQVFTERGTHPAVTQLFKKALIQGRAAGVHVWAGTHKPTVTMFGHGGNAVRDMFDATIGLRVPTATSSRVLRGDDACMHLLGQGDARVFAPIADGQYVDARVQMAYIPEAQLLAASGGHPVMDRWPPYDTSKINHQNDGKRGRARSQFTDEQLAISIYGAQQPRPWGRDILEKELERAGCPVPGHSKLDRLLKKGRRIAAFLDEI